MSAGVNDAPLVPGGVVERYLLLGLRLGRHLDGLVDAYYGPPVLARRVDDEAKTDLGELKGHRPEPVRYSDEMVVVIHEKSRFVSIRHRADVA